MGQSNVQFNSHFNELFWRPAEAFDASSSKIELFDEQNRPLGGTLSLTKSKVDSDISFELKGFDSRPSFAVVTSADGYPSCPAIIHILDALRAEAKEASTKRVDRLAQELRNGNFEGVWVLDVLEDLQKIEASQTPELIDSGTTKQRTMSKDGQSNTYKTLSYADFVRGRKPELTKIISPEALSPEARYLL